MNTSYKHNVYLFRSLPSLPSSYIYFYIMYYSFYIFITGSLSGWSHHLAFGLLHRSIGRTARFIEFIADQLIGLFVAHASSSATPGTPRCSDMASYAEDSSVLGHRQQCQGLLGAWTSPARQGLLGARTSPDMRGDSSELGHR